MTRPAASKRAVRRRYAILGVLALDGPSYALDLCKALRRGPGTIYPDLSWMEIHGLVAADWVNQSEGRPRRRRYRLTTPAEREENSSLDDRLRAMLQERRHGT